jgi:SAM-dependent methyltransferase
MEIRDSRIDAGKAFDWGRTSEDYARFRDIYPELFYQKIADLGLCLSGQNVLDLGTGTGVLPRNMYRFGAKWTGTDISPEQIAQAERLSREAGMDITFQAAAAEDLVFPSASFDVITACQCFWYFDHEKLAPMLADFLKENGKLVVLYMAWLPFEDEIAGKSEQLVLKYNPRWTGAGETRHPIHIDDAVFRFFEMEGHEEYAVRIPFTRESWHGRMRACRGVGASLSGKELAAWEKEHLEMLEKCAPDCFDVQHYAAITVLKMK